MMITPSMEFVALDRKSTIDMLLKIVNGIDDDIKIKGIVYILATQYNPEMLRALVPDADSVETIIEDADTIIEDTESIADSLPGSIADSLPDSNSIDTIIQDEELIVDSLLDSLADSIADSIPINLSPRGI
jgi:hypothetical protein